MQTDETLEVIAHDIKGKLKAKHGVDYDVDQIIKIFRTQFDLLEHFMEDEEIIKIKYLGKFKIKEKRKEVMLRDHERFRKLYEKTSKKVHDAFDDGIEFEILT